MGDQIEVALSQLTHALARLNEPYIPGPREKQHLERALYHLLRAREGRDFADDEDSVWNCGSMKIDGEDRGGWEIRLRPTEPPSTAP